MLSTSECFLREHTGKYSCSFELQPNGMIMELLWGGWEARLYIRLTKQMNDCISCVNPLKSFELLMFGEPLPL